MNEMRVGMGLPGGGMDLYSRRARTLRHNICLQITGMENR